MSYPSGAPGGFPGDPAQPPHTGAVPPPNPYAGPRPGSAPFGPPPGLAAPGGNPPNLTQILFAATGVLGVVNLFLGFANLQSASAACADLPDVAQRACAAQAQAASSPSFFAAGAGWIPALLAVAGLLALTTLLPERRGTRSGAPIAALTAGAVLPGLFALWSTSALGFGGITVMILAILQLVAAAGAALFESGLLRLPARPHVAASQPGGFPPAAGFPPPNPYAGPSMTPAAAPNPPARPTEFMQHPGQLSQQNLPPSTPGGSTPS